MEAKPKYDMMEYNALAGCCLTWFAVFAQLVLMFMNTELPPLEIGIRFFSYFTILSNILVAIMFSVHAFGIRGHYLGRFNRKTTATALCSCILTVGLVYQVILRPLWDPTGLQALVDELLHTFIPLFTLLYWYWYRPVERYRFKKVLSWLIYPITYVVLVLLRGYWSGFYPYPFLNVPKIGIKQTAMHIGIISIVILLIMCILHWISLRKQDKSIDHDFQH